MGYFQVRYDSRVLIYERKMFIRLATGANAIKCKFKLYEFLSIPIGYKI